jgi:hypothetical protein
MSLPVGTVCYLVGHGLAPEDIGKACEINDGLSFHLSANCGLVWSYGIRCEGADWLARPENLQPIAGPAGDSLARLKLLEPA